MFHTLEEKVQHAFHDHIQARYGIDLAIAVEQPKQSDFGELAVPAAFQLAKQLKQAPRKIAAELAAAGGARLFADLLRNHIDQVIQVGRSDLFFSNREDHRLRGHFRRGSGGGVGGLRGQSHRGLRGRRGLREQACHRCQAKQKLQGFHLLHDTRTAMPALQPNCWYRLMQRGLLVALALCAGRHAGK